MKTALALGVALLASGLLSAQDASLKPKACEPLTGPITFKEKDSRRLGIRIAEGKAKTFTVDAVAMPHWFEDFQVGERVTVTCKDAGEEHRPIATSVKAAPDEAKP
jgi:hypothetical protein